MINYNIILQSPLFLFIEFIAIVVLSINLPIILAFMISGLFYWWLLGCCILLQREFFKLYKPYITVYIFIATFIFLFGPVYVYITEVRYANLSTVLEYIYFTIAISIYIWLSYIIVTVEKLKGLKRVGRFITFLQIVFFPIGVWFLQPRIKRLILN